VFLEVVTLLSQLLKFAACARSSPVNLSINTYISSTALTPLFSLFLLILSTDIDIYLSTY